MKKVLKIFVVTIMAFTLLACKKTETSVQLRFGRVDYAAHGTKSFAVTDVVLADDKIIAVYIDEYQFLSTETFEVTPNGELMVKGISEEATIALASKRLNNEAYSANMKNNGGASQDLASGYKAIEDYVTGKTITELEAAINGKTAEEVVSEGLVSGATLQDTLGYIESVIASAKAAQKTDGVTYTGDTTKLKLGRIDYAAHGTKAFAITSVVTDGTNIILAYIDEIQFMAANSVTAVANSAAMVSAVSQDATVAIAFKRVNNVFYSNNMANSGGATKELAEGYAAIEAYVAGKTISEVETAVDGKTTEDLLNDEIVSGSTLADTSNYILSIVKATTVAK